MGGRYMIEGENMEVLDQCQVVPAVMQVECHPYYPAELAKKLS